MRRALPLIICVALCGTALAGPRWSHVVTKDGFIVTARDQPGRGFPTFRGVGVIDANIFDIIAVISDVGRHTEWIYKCKSARLLRKVSPTERVVYGRTDAPWPVSDRDAVFYSRAVVDLKRREVVIKFRAVESPLQREVSGVVRMKNLSGHYKLRALSWSRTAIEYQVNADPGGWLPKWIAKIATRRLPLYTLRNLRAQVRKTRGWYKTRIKRWKAMHYQRWQRQASVAARP